MCQYWDNHLIYWVVYWPFYWHVPMVTHCCAIVTIHLNSVHLQVTGGFLKPNISMSLFYACRMESPTQTVPTRTTSHSIGRLRPGGLALFASSKHTDMYSCLFSPLEGPGSVYMYRISFFHLQTNFCLSLCSYTIVRLLQRWWANEMTPVIQECKLESLL